MTKAIWKNCIATGMLVLAFTAPALAQDSDTNWWSRMGMGQMMMMGGMGGMGMGGMGMGGMGMGPMGGPMMGLSAPDFMVDRIDGRLAFLKTELKITGEQEQAWGKLATTIRDTAQSHNEMMGMMMQDVESGGFFERSLPDRLDFQAARMEARLEEVKSLKSAVDDLYAVLSDEQKQVADEIVLPTMGMGMGRWHGFGRDGMRKN